MVAVLERHGLTRTVIDPCLFVLVTSGFVLKAGTHVDDFIFTTNHPHRFSEWFDEVCKELNMSAASSSRSSDRLRSVRKEEASTVWILWTRRWAPTREPAMGTDPRTGGHQPENW